MTKRTYSIRQIIAIRSKVAGKTSSTPAASAPKTEREAKPYTVTVVAAEERNRNTDGAGFTALRVKVDGWKVREDLWTGATVDGVGHGLQPGMRLDVMGLVNSYPSNTNGPQGKPYRNLSLRIASFAPATEMAEAA